MSFDFQGHDFSTVKLVATDMDGTLTLNEKFAPRLIQRLWDLNLAKIPVWIVTGRSAGWVQGLLEYLPVAGAIAENGGYFFTPEHSAGLALIPLKSQDTYRQKLRDVFQQLTLSFPQIQTSSDNVFRITDWTFDNRALSNDDLSKINHICQNLGWSFTYSSIQCHIKANGQNKQAGVLKALEQVFPFIHPHQVLTMGDSPNDADLLDPQVFPHSFGVANIRPYLESMPHQPHGITQGHELLGFLEVTEHLLAGES